MHTTLASPLIGCRFDSLPLSMIYVDVMADENDHKHETGKFKDISKLLFLKMQR